MRVIGETNHRLHLMLRLVLRGSSGREQTIVARLDTGFDLALAVPPAVVSALGLEYVRDLDMTMADGSTASFSQFRARIVWDGLERPVRVLAKPGQPLVGIALLAGYHLGVDFLDGGAVAIREVA